MRAPVLSILIPAYEYSFGVRRILDSVAESLELDPQLKIECIISDDSETGEVEEMVAGHVLYNYKCFRYVKREKSLGAIANWNFLLSEATGEYIHFMHHDEFPCDSNFFGVLVSELEANVLSDVLFLRCYVPTFIKNRFRPLVGSVVRSLYFVSPEGLFLRNTVGSPTSAVIRRKKCLLFDLRLQWIVDLEWYYRILNKNTSGVSFSDLKYISVFRNESISSKISSEVKAIDRHERQLIKKDYSALFLDRYEDSLTMRYKIFLYLESIFWLSCKVIHYPFGIMLGTTVNSDLIGTEYDDRK